MPRSPNKIETDLLKISTTPTVRHYLERLVETGLYGKSAPEAAERLITRSLEALLREGSLRRIDGQVVSDDDIGSPIVRGRTGEDGYDNGKHNRRSHETSDHGPGPAAAGI